MKIESFISRDDWAGRVESFVPNESVLSKMFELNNKLTYEPGDFSDEYANIFIFGLARSGTTLASQLIADNTNLGYINNLSASFWENPQYGVYLSLHLGVQKRISYVSDLGRTETIGDISEFGYFWAPLLGHKTAAQLGENDRSNIKWPLLVNKVLSINHAFSSSCVYKNLLLGHYAKELNQSFNSPLFIYVRRRYIDTAYSIFRAREKRYGSSDHWLSTKPYEYKKLAKLPPHEQIIAQMYYLEKDFNLQIENIIPNRLLIVDYDKICQEPNSFLTELKNKLHNLGQNISIKPFNKSLRTSSIENENEDVLQLQEHLNRYFVPGSDHR